MKKLFGGQPVLTPLIPTEAWGGKRPSSPELSQENLHHSCHVHIHMHREGGLGGSRGFNVVNLQESVSVRHNHGLRASRNGEPPPRPSTASTPMVPIP